MLFTGGATSARVAVDDRIGCKSQGVDQLLCIAPVFPYGLVIFSCAFLHEVYRQLPLSGLSVCSGSSRKHQGAKLGIVCRLLLGLGQVSSLPQDLQHVSLLSHGLLGTSAVAVCGDVADDGGLRIAEEFSADFLHSLVLSAYWTLVG